MSRVDHVLTPSLSLPDEDNAVLVGRVWRSDVGGPAIVSVRDGDVVDITSRSPTLAHLICSDDPVALAGEKGERLGSVDQILANSSYQRRREGSWFLAPVDLQPVKATGVTFAASLLERIIEEKAGGDKEKSEEIRADLASLLGSDIQAIRPGSPDAERLMEHMRKAGMWSQYLEVGIGVDAEIFSKCPPLAAVGTGSQVGILASSEWNNPEPELALVVSDSGEIVGATLANDVNLRDVEGRSALLLGKAKDNNASTAIGPLMRLLDANFSLDHLRQLDVHLHLEGTDGFVLDDTSSISLISRDLTDLVSQTIGESHQYPDGLVLLSGTMFAPIVDRGTEGSGFTHFPGDVVEISSPSLGTLVNTVGYCHEIEPWTFGIRALMQSLADRGHLPRPGQGV